MWGSIFLCSLAATLGLRLEVLVHYPESNSAVDHCGFRFLVSTSVDARNSPVPAMRVGQDLFRAEVHLSDHYLFTRPSVAVFAEHSPSDANSIAGARGPPGGMPGILPPANGSASEDLCSTVCPRLSPARIGQLGRYERTAPLGAVSAVNIWPHFCQTEWQSRELSLWSEAIQQNMTFVSRIPAAVLENPLPRPSQRVPPIMFRLNAEWFWEHNDRDYNTWHDLMLMGEMEPVVVVEVSIKGFDWKTWDRQPILSTENLRLLCSSCDSEIEFICRHWETGSYFVFWGGNHSFGQAEQFFDEMYDQAVPKVQSCLPLPTDSGRARVGVWGYCIGGLAAWNAITIKPGRFNIAYLGSPALDFNCGDAFHQVANITWGEQPPKIYIDSGAAEDGLMNRQSLLLFRKLQSRGLMEGRDLFYTRVEFGTHEGHMLWRRSLKGLLALFGTNPEEQYTPVLQQPSITEGDAAFVQHGWLINGWAAAIQSGPSMFIWAASLACAFVVGRLTSGRGVANAGLTLPLLGSLACPQARRLTR